MSLLQLIAYVSHKSGQLASYNCERATEMADICWYILVYIYIYITFLLLRISQNREFLSLTIPKCSMYGIFTYIYPKNDPVL